MLLAENRVDARPAQRVLIIDRSRLEASWLAEFLVGSEVAAWSAELAHLEQIAGEVRPTVLLVDGALVDEQVAARVEALGAQRVIVLTDGPGTAGARIRRSLTMSRRHHPEDLVAVIHGADVTALAHDTGPGVEGFDDKAASRLQQLTAREMDVLRALLRGAVTHQLAEGLGISPNTMRTHVQNVFGKLGVHSRLEAVTLALRAGLRDDFVAVAATDA
jgi:two-component system, NarL family, nitrate/nitrite response regulator NarL